MNRLCFFCLTLITLFSASCGEKTILSKTGTVNLLWKLKYGDKDLVMFDNYNYPTGQKLFFSKFGFFISELSLKNTSGYKQYVDVDYINLTNSFTGAANAAKGHNYAISKVDIGQYSSLKFNIGVPKESNDKTPANFSSSNVLSNQSEYWGDWRSYIFTRTEGQIDLDGDGTIEESFGLHTGSNAALKSFEFPISKELTSDGSITITIDIDLKKQFGESPYYNIVNSPQIHSMSQSALVKELSDNLAKGILIR